MSNMNDDFDDLYPLKLAHDLGLCQLSRKKQIIAIYNVLMVTYAMIGEEPHSILINPAMLPEFEKLDENQDSVA
jgi:hypothetical protein